MIVLTVEGDMVVLVTTVVPGEERNENEVWGFMVMEGGRRMKTPDKERKRDKWRATIISNDNDEESFRVDGDLRKGHDHCRCH
ncbi:hypothetical protein VNO77_23387 [Canavalia gladiata]|uniref:Uncharacterized protein n=1 Tax=Canavalia gladiata TaxID=3824 RepID=A0AAN9L4B7_CANGL